jgi:hypothetical protein
MAPVIPLVDEFVEDIWYDEPPVSLDEQPADDAQEEPRKADPASALDSL